MMSEQFWLTALTAVLAALPATVAALVGLRKIQALHIDVNSRLTKMLEMAQTDGEARGELKGRVNLREEIRVEELNHAPIVQPLPLPIPVVLVEEKK